MAADSATESSVGGKATDIALKYLVPIAIGLGLLGVLWFLFSAGSMARQDGRTDRQSQRQKSRQDKRDGRYAAKADRKQQREEKKYNRKALSACKKDCCERRWLGICTKWNDQCRSRCAESSVRRAAA